MPKPSWEVVRFNPLLQKDAPTRDAYAAIVVEELVRYDAAWIGRSKVTTVALVGRLTVDGQSRAGVPDYLAGVLYLDPFVGAFNDTYRRHVIHHELFHAVEAAVHGDPYFDDPAWRRMNDPAFRYGSGGAASRDAAVTVLNHPAAGFINQYAEAAVEEDKAELFAALMTPAEAPLIERWALTDPILRNKALYLRRYAATLRAEPPRPATDGFSALGEWLDAARAALLGANTSEKP